MRENIIEQLRFCAAHFSCDGCGGDCKTGSNEPRTKAMLNDAADAIEELLAAVNSVVKCKDCKFWTKQESSAQGRCALLAMYPTGGFYCGSGRKDDA